MRFKAALAFFCTVFFTGISCSFADVSAGSKGLIWQSEDEQVRLTIGGRLHYDAVSFDKENTKLMNEESLRRARIYISGRIKPDWTIKIERELSASHKSWKNLWLRYSGLDNAVITVGNQLAPFGMEGTDSSNRIKLIERSLANVLAPSYYFGVSYSHYWGDLSFTGGIFTDRLTEGSVSSNEGEGSLNARLTYAPVHTKTATLHLGFSTEYRYLNENKAFRIRSRPEVGITQKRLVNTGRISNVVSTMGNSVEIAGAYNNFLLQGEYTNRIADRSLADNLSFSGCYIQGAWVLTGERHRYAKKSGHFKIKPEGKFGAVELTTRYSHINLDDKKITGGRQKNYTIGINWYLNDNARIMANYISMDVDNRDSSQSSSLNAFLTRFQIAF